jgi:hypothetical protein
MVVCGLVSAPVTEECAYTVSGISVLSVCVSTQLLG